MCILEHMFIDACFRDNLPYFEDEGRHSLAEGQNGIIMSTLSQTYCNMVTRVTLESLVLESKRTPEKKALGKKNRCYYFFTHCSSFVVHISWQYS